MQVYELITCVRRANENAGNVISVVQFLITKDIRSLGSQSERAFNAIHCFFFFCFLVDKKHGYLLNASNSVVANNDIQ